MSSTRGQAAGASGIVQDGFGWTNGVVRGLLRLSPDLRSASACESL